MDEGWGIAISDLFEPWGRDPERLEIFAPGDPKKWELWGPYFRLVYLINKAHGQIQELASVEHQHIMCSFYKFW